MAFMGETADVGVGELLSVLARRGNTGRLHINMDGEEVQVILNGGKVTQVSSSHHSLRIGRVLVRMGLLEEDGLNEAVKEAALDFAIRGWHVFPRHTFAEGKCSCGVSDCSSPGKHPRDARGRSHASNRPKSILSVTI